MQKIKVESWDEHRRYIETEASSVFPQFSESTVLTPLRPLYPMQQLFDRKHTSVSFCNHHDLKYFQFLLHVHYWSFGFWQDNRSSTSAEQAGRCESSHSVAQFQGEVRIDFSHLSCDFVTRFFNY
jgi:hypothetical protein